MTVRRQSNEERLARADRDAKWLVIGLTVVGIIGMICQPRRIAALLLRRKGWYE